MASYAPGGLGYEKAVGQRTYHTATPWADSSSYARLQSQYTPAEHTAYHVQLAEASTALYPSYLRQWEVLRFVEPQGPLKPTEIAQADLPTNDKPIHTISESLQAVYARRPNSADKKKSGLPPKLPTRFSTELSAHNGDEEVLNKSGKLVYRAALSFAGGVNIRFFMAPPVIGASCRLWRQFPTVRLLRVSVDVEDMRACQRNPRPGGHNDAATSLKIFLATPIAVNGHIFRCFYEKENSLYFWAEGSIPSLLKQIKPISLYAFVDQLIPFSDGENDTMEPSKFAARIKLWLSKTEEVATVDSVRWVPDITPRTLRISVEAMQTVKETLGIHHVPSCIAGDVNGQRRTWAIRTDPDFPVGGIELRTWAVLQAHNESLPVKVNFRIVLGFERTLKKVSIPYTEECIVHVEEPPWAAETELMTDGNALMSYGLAKAVKDKFGCPGIPAAVQARIGGAKGMWNIECQPDPYDTKLWIEIRDSQWKNNVKDGFNWILEVINVSGPSSSKRIGNQILQVLEYAQEEERSERIRAIIAAAQVKQAEAREDEIFGACERGSLRRTLEKLRNDCPRISEVVGGATVRFGDAEEEDEGLFEESMFDTHPASGRPTDLAAQAIAMLDAGFFYGYPPFDEILERLDKGKRNSEELAGRVDLESSGLFYAIADPTGELDEGTAALQASGDPIFDSETGLQLPAMLDCDVLITRNPCIQSSDIQKVTCVTKKAYRHLHNVLICSTKGKMSLMAKLSGGDMDGDVVRVIWDPRIVNEWVNDETNIKPPYEEKDYFEKVPYTVGKQVVKNVAEMNVELARTGEDRSKLLQQLLLTPMYIERAYGWLSTMHSKLFDDSRNLFYHRTVEAGHLYAQALDAAKAGKRFTRDRWELELAFGLKSCTQLTIPAGRGPVTPKKREADKPGGGTPSSTSSWALRSPAAELSHSFKRMIRVTPLKSKSTEEPPSSSNNVDQTLGLQVAAEHAHAQLNTLAEALDEAAAPLLHVAKKRSGLRTSHIAVDPDLLQPWTDAQLLKGAACKPADAKYLESLWEHVGVCLRKYQDYRKAWAEYSEKAEGREADGNDSGEAALRKRAKARSAFKKSQQAMETDIINIYCDGIQDVPEGSNIAVDGYTLAASCACYRAKKEGAKVNGFPLFVAFRTIMDIKADAVEKQKTGSVFGPRKITTETFNILGSKARPEKRIRDSYTDSDLEAEHTEDAQTREGGSPQKKIKRQ